MRSTNLSGIILEGIPGTGKSTTLKAFLCSPHWQEKSSLSSLVLSEHQTLRVLEWKERASKLAKQASINLLTTHLNYLENLKNNLDQTDWLSRDRQAQKVPFIFERFHLSHVYHYPSVSWSDVSSIDERLALVHAKLIVLILDPEDMEQRIIQDYKKSGWQDYLRTLGRNDQEVVAYFMQKQTELLDMTKQTKLPVKILNTSQYTTKEIIEQILLFWSF